MKTLFILTKDQDATISAIMDERAKESGIEVIDLRSVQDYDMLVTYIDECDQVITW